MSTNKRKLMEKIKERSGKLKRSRSNMSLKKYTIKEIPAGIQVGNTVDDDVLETLDYDTNRNRKR